MIQNKNSSDYILESSREYAIYVCDQRAIPLVSDGLKSGQRKALWIIRNKNDKIKTISLSGEMISSGLYVHGDQSAAQTISMMAGPFCNNLPFLNGIGSFGTKVNPQAFGAPRYTYVKKNKAAEEILFKDLDIVPMKENYDGSVLEPVSFLPIIPTILLNGISGIAVGWSTEILPYDLKDIIKATTEAIKGKNITKLIPSYSYLDIKGKNIEGNSWEFIGKFIRKDTSTLVITALPPDLSLEKFKERLDTLEENDVINDYTDNSSENIEIEIKLKRGSLVKITDEQIIEMFKLRTRKTERIITIDFSGNSIKQYNSPEELIIAFVNWRFGYYIKRYEKLLNDSKNELIYWVGLKKCFEKNLPNKILKASNKAEVLKIIFNIDNALTDAYQEKIASLPTYRWNAEYYQEVLKKIEEIENNIKNYEDLLSNPHKIKDIFCSEVNNLLKIKF